MPDGRATNITDASSNVAFVTELLYNRLSSVIWQQGRRWIDSRGLTSPCTPL